LIAASAQSIFNYPDDWLMRATHNRCVPITASCSALRAVPMGEISFSEGMALPKAGECQSE